MKKAILAVLVAAALMCGCPRSGTGPAPSDDGADGGASSGAADLGAQSLSGANPPPVVDQVVEDGGTLLRRFNAEPDTLNPLTGRDAYGSALMGYITDSLATRNPDTLEWEPQLAESWESSEDHLSYIFHLRSDVKWHDGEPFTSADLVYSFEKVMDPAVDAPHLRSYYQDLESVTAPDDRTVVFTWKKPYFLSFNFSAGFPVLPKHVFDDGTDFNTHPASRAPVGNGMYRFAGWGTNEEIVLERNEDYHGRKPHIKRMVVRFVPDNNSALMQAGGGVIDYMGVQPEQWVNELTADVYQRNFNRYYYYTPNYNYIGWNLRRPFFAEKKVRLAMTHLVHREAILQEILYGLGRIVTGTFYMNGEDYSADIEPWPYDPDAARRLLDESGWVDTDDDGIRDKLIDGESVPFTFNFMYPSGSNLAEKVGILLQGELKKLGVEMNIQNREWAIFTERLNEGDFDAVTLGWSLGIEQDPYQLWHSSQVDRGSNFIAFRNDEIDGIIEAARVEFDAEKRHELYDRFNRIVHDEQPYTFLFCRPNLEIVNNRFHNVIVHTLGLDHRDWYVPPALRK